MTIEFSYPPALYEEYARQSEQLQDLKAEGNLETSGEAMALQQGIYLGSHGMDITVDQLMKWHLLILRDYENQGEKKSREASLPVENTKRKELETFLGTINLALKNENLLAFPLERVKYLASIFCTFNRLSPFSNGGDAVGRILVNFVNSRLFSPIYLFRASESKEIKDAREDEKMAQTYFAKKIKEAVFDNHFSYLRCIGSSGKTFFYRGSEGQKLTVQWHEKG